MKIPDYLKNLRQVGHARGRALFVLLIGATVLLSTLAYAGHASVMDRAKEATGKVIVSFVTAAYSGENVNFMPGLLIECSIICDDLTPRQHLFRFFESLLY